MKKLFLLCTICVLMVFTISCKKNQDMVVAIIDTGIDENHPDLKEHLWENHTSLPGKHGYDFINDDADPQDDQGHGTHCAGVILEQAKKEGIASHVKFMAIKYMDEKGTANLKRVIECYRYIINAKKQGVNVVAINNSWGMDENSPELKSLIEEAGKLGILSFQAAGNTAEDLDVKKTYPAAYRSPYTVVVAASTQNNQLADFSCYGKSTVNIAAPGTGIVAPYFKDFYLPQDNLDKNKVWSLVPSQEKYTENSKKTYQNLIQWNIEPKCEFWGMDYQYQGKTKKWGAVEAKVGEMWMNIGTLPLRSENFTDTQVFSLPEGAQAVRLIVPKAEEGDKITIVKAGAGKTTGKYAKLTGTSMATPYAVGGYLKLYYDAPKENVETLRNQLLSHVVPLKSNKAIEGNGIFSLEAKSQPVINGYKDGIVFGDFFGTQPGTITVNGKEAKVLEWNATQIKIEPPALPLGASVISISKPDAFTRHYCFYVNPKWDGYKDEIAMPEPIVGGVVGTFSNKIILLGGSGKDGQNNQNIFSYDPQEKKWEKVGSINEKQADILSIGASSIMYQGKCYITAFDNMEQKTVFYTYTPQEGLKEINIHMPFAISRGTFTLYHDELYLVGGSEKSAVTNRSYLLKYHAKNQSFEKIATLHHERFSPIVVNQEKGFYIIGGLYGDNLPVEEVEYFDGREVKTVPQIPAWKASTEEVKVIDQNYVLSDGVELRNGRFINGEFANKNLPLGRSVCQNFMAVSYQGKGYIFGGTEDLNPTTRVYSFDLKSAEKESQ